MIAAQLVEPYPTFEQQAAKGGGHHGNPTPEPATYGIAFVGIALFVVLCHRLYKTRVR